MRTPIACLAAAAAVLLSGCATIDWNHSAVEKGSKVAVLAYEKDGHDDAETLSMIESDLIGLGLKVVDRSTFETLMKEQKLGLTGALRAEDAQAIGKMSGAKDIFIWVATRGVDGGIRYGSLRLVNVERGEVLSSELANTANLDYFLKKAINGHS